MFNLVAIVVVFSCVVCQQPVDPTLVQTWAGELSRIIQRTTKTSTGAEQLTQAYQSAWDAGLGKLSTRAVHGRITESVGALQDLFENTRVNIMKPSKDELERQLQKDWTDRKLGIACSGDRLKTPKCVDTTQFFEPFISEGSAPGHLTHSTVTFAQGVDKTSPEVQKELEISAELDDIFIDVHNKHSSGSLSSFGPVYLQYYASQSGFTRWFPGRPSWEGEDAFDARERPWYVIAASGPKKVVLVLDSSGSMLNGGRWTSAQAAARTVLRTLTIYDWVNIVMFSDTVTVPTCFAETMVRATPANIAELESFVETVQPVGGTNFTVGLEAAYNMLHSAAHIACHPIILFMTDGEDNQDRSGRTQTQYMRQRDNKGEVRVFTYALSADASETAPKLMAKDTGGVYAKITHTSNLKKVMSRYYQYLAHSVQQQYVFSSPYIDASENVAMISLVRPIFDSTCSPPVFTGVLATDIVLSDIMRLIYYDNTDSHYITLVSNTAQVLTHPKFFSPEDERLKTYKQFNYVDISNLELPIGHSSANISSSVEQQFSVVRQAIVDYIPISNFSITMPRLKSGGDVHKDGVREVQLQVTYNCQPIQGSTFSICEVIESAASSSFIEWSWSDHQNIPQSWYHRIDVSHTTTAPRSNTLAANTNSKLLIKGLQYQGFEYNAYRSVDVATVVTAARVFQNPKNYIKDISQRYQNPQFTDDEIQQSNLLQDALNTANGVVTGLQHRFRPDVLSDIHISQSVQSTWKTNFNASEHSLLYYGSSTGTFQVYPGVNYHYLFDPLTRFWYKQITRGTSNFVVTTPYRDASTGELVVTAGKKINIDCSSSTSCQQGVTQGAVAFDWVLSQVQAAVAKASAEKCFRWGTTTTAPSTSTDDIYSCYLVDSSAFLIYHPTFWQTLSGEEVDDVFMGHLQRAQPLLIELTAILQRNTEHSTGGLFLKEEHVIDYTDGKQITYFEFSHSDNADLWTIQMSNNVTATIAKVANTNIYLIVSKGVQSQSGGGRGVQPRQASSKAASVCDKQYQQGLASTVQTCRNIRLTEDEISEIGNYCNLPRISRTGILNGGIDEELTQSRSTGEAADEGGTGGVMIVIIIGLVLVGCLLIAVLLGCYFHNKHVEVEEQAKNRRQQQYQHHDDHYGYQYDENYTTQDLYLYSQYSQQSQSPPFTSDYHLY